MNLSDQIWKATRIALPRLEVNAPLDFVMRGDGNEADGTITAIVYRAREPVVVVKFPRGTLGDTIEREHSNMRRVADMFGRRGLVGLPGEFGLAYVDSRPFLVVGYVSGVLLTSYFTHRSRTNTRIALGLGLRVATWLREFHSLRSELDDLEKQPSAKTETNNLGPTHGDLLCRNIMVSRAGPMLVLDWQNFSLDEPQVVDLVTFVLDLATWTLRSDAHLIRETFVPSGRFAPTAARIFSFYDKSLIDDDMLQGALRGYFAHIHKRTGRRADRGLVQMHSRLEREFESCELSVSLAAN